MVKNILIGILIAALSGLLITIYTKNRNLEKALLTSSQALQEANLNIGRAETKIADANTMISKLNKNIQDEIRKREGVLTLYGELEAQLQASKERVKTLTKIVYKDKIIDLPKNKLFVRLESGEYQEVEALTYSYSDFRIDISGNAIKQTLTYKLHQKFKGHLVETLLPNGSRNHYFTLYELDDENKVISELKLDKFQVVRTNELENKFIWWNPKLDISLGSGINSKLDFNWQGDIGLSISSYGKTTHNPMWRFFRAGVGLSNKDLSLSAEPALFNLGSLLPIVDNLYLGPYISYQITNKIYSVGLGINISL